MDHLPERDRPAVKRRLRAAWALASHETAIERLRGLAGELAHAHPGACASLREGLEETVTVQRLGITGKLKRTLESTNPIESMIECIRRTSRNVKHWQNGDMALRWTAAGMLEAERQFRRVIGHADLATLAVAVERDLQRARNAHTPHAPSSTPTEEPATLISA
jgi:putative transposase